MMLLLHPREATLLRYAAGSAQDTARRRVASHLADCDKCRGTVQSTRQLRVALASGGAVGAPDPLLQRILQSRMQGERVILPVEAPVMQQAFSAPSFAVTRSPGNGKLVRPAFWLVLGGAAAVALVQVGSNQFEKSMVRNPDGRISPRFEVNPKEVAQLKQELARQRLFPAPVPVNPGRLRPVTLKYGYVNYDGNEARLTPTDSDLGPIYQIVRDPGSSTQWILISQRNSQWGTIRGPDSVWINGETLEANRWSNRFTVHGARVENFREVLGDKLHFIQRYSALPGTTLSDSNRTLLEERYRPYDRTSPRREWPSRSEATPVQNQVHFIAMMMTMPLQVGWRGRFSANDCCLSFTTNVGSIEVTGSHLAITPAGIFDCWESVEASRFGKVIRWFRKSDGVLVGESNVEAGTAQLTTLLIAEE